MLGKLIGQIISVLLGKGFALIMGFLQKRRVQKLERQVLTQKDKITILEHEKRTAKKIQDWKYRLDNKESDSLAKELNKIRNEK
jgi:Mg2+/citrate symporter